MATVCAIELPALKLVDPSGRNWTALRRREPLVSKQVLIPQLQAAGFDVTLLNLKDDDDEIEYGRVRWRDQTLTKLMVGRELDLDARDYDVWAITINYIQEREPACMIVRELAAAGGRVIVGGSDAFAEPEPYLEAGAAAVVRDKSGAANAAIVDFVLGETPREPLSGAMLADGSSFAPKSPPMSPEDWPLPDEATIRRTLGIEYWETVLPDELLPIGSVMADIGCDRKCDFCETPLYKVGYQAMSPATTLRWFDAQKAAGARSVICPSDQFLGRVLWDRGRAEVLEIMQGIRDLDLTVLWGNGLEIQKLTRGRSLPDGDMSPDDELVGSVWGWDGRVGCYQGYIPAERPTFGREAYNKLLPWREHCAMVEEIVRSGVPDITYGVVVGLPEDSDESFRSLEEAIIEVNERAKAINPDVVFTVTPYALRPIPGTPQNASLRQQGLLRFDDPAVIGGFWTACADTHHLSYEAVSDWQSRIAALGDGTLLQWQSLTGPGH